MSTRDSGERPSNQPESTEVPAADTAKDHAQTDDDGTAVDTNLTLANDASGGAAPGHAEADPESVAVDADAAGNERSVDMGDPADLATDTDASGAAQSGGQAALTGAEAGEFAPERTTTFGLHGDAPKSAPSRQMQRLIDHGFAYVDPDRDEVVIHYTSTSAASGEHRETRPDDRAASSADGSETGGPVGAADTNYEPTANTDADQDAESRASNDVLPGLDELVEEDQPDVPIEQMDLDQMSDDQLEKLLGGKSAAELEDLFRKTIAKKDELPDNPENLTIYRWWGKRLSEEDQARQDALDAPADPDQPHPDSDGKLETELAELTRELEEGSADNAPAEASAEQRSPYGMPEDLSDTTWLQLRQDEDWLKRYIDEVGRRPTRSAIDNVLRSSGRTPDDATSARHRLNSVLQHAGAAKAGERGYQVYRARIKESDFNYVHKVDGYGFTAGGFADTPAGRQYLNDREYERGCELSGIQYYLEKFRTQLVEVGEHGGLSGMLERRRLESQIAVMKIINNYRLDEAETATANRSRLEPRTESGDGESRAPDQARQTPFHHRFEADKQRAADATGDLTQFKAWIKEQSYTGQELIAYGTAAQRLQPVLDKFDQNLTIDEARRAIEADKMELHIDNPKPRSANGRQLRLYEKLLGDWHLVEELQREGIKTAKGAAYYFRLRLRQFQELNSESGPGFTWW